MKSKLDIAVTGTLVICAILTTGLVLRRELLTSPKAATQPERRSVFIPQWKEALIRGTRIGPESARVQLIEFADFECPFCGSFHRTIKALRERYPDQIALTYVHFPIQGHRFALPSARAAECADEQGRFEAIHDHLFEEQDKLGLKSWSEFATEAGISNITAFDACIKKTDPIAHVEEGKALGAKLDVQGTPTVIINGWKLGHPPAAEELDQMVQRVLAGKQPVDGKT
jgi:protein-disulfide isomerase